jgi:Uma2 family endonuclease
MSTDSITRPMTSEELFALPFNKKWQRWLFRGELRSRRMTKRNPSHSGVVSRVSQLLKNWLDAQPRPWGKVYGGELYFRIRRDPDTNAGIDVALASAELAAATGKKASFVDGPPVLAVEVLSPYDKMKEAYEMVGEYLDCGVRLVWVIDPMDETVLIHRPGKPPELVKVTHDLTADPELPGFSVPVCRLFE